MARLSDKNYDDFRKICEKEGIKYESEAEMRESADKLVDLVRILSEMDRERHGWEERLKDEPKGFALESEGRTCGLCRESIWGDIWYDKWGLSCMNCHAAYTKGIIPGYAIKDTDNEKSVTASTLSWKYDIRHQTIMKLVRQGKLTARQVPQGPTVFLRKENPDMVDIIEAEKSTLALKTRASN